MATDLPTTNGVHDTKINGHGPDGQSSFAVKAGLARMLKGGVIMDVINVEQVRHPAFHLSPPTNTDPPPRHASPKKRAP